MVLNTKRKCNFHAFSPQHSPQFFGGCRRGFSQLTEAFRDYFFRPQNLVAPEEPALSAKEDQRRRLPLLSTMLRWEPRSMR